MSVSRTVVAAVLAAALAWPQWASAKEKQEAKKAPRPTAAKTEEQGKAPQVEIERTGRKKVYRIKTELVIEGRIQKPNAFYVLQRSTINYEWVDLKQDFIPPILNSVRESPF
jgi:hypothetical protein